MSSLFYRSLSGQAEQPAGAARGAAGARPDPHPRLARARQTEGMGILSAEVFTRPLPPPQLTAEGTSCPVRGETEYANKMLDVFRFFLKFP